MPKRVDPHERRTLLADALMRVAAQRGLTDVSLRHVAAEAGVTAGMVQHYFRTKDEMMVFALGAVRDRVEQRLAVDPAMQDGSSRRRVEALLEQLLPLDEERTLEAHVGLAFQAYAAVKPEIAAELRADTERMRHGLAEWIADAGKVDDPRRAATALLSLVEGLALHVLGQHFTVDEARATLHAHLDLVI
ncbi:TetR/AcrR family transcriptional regulator [Actinomycetospora soli]|uniref:TetR/AcrR family transcriptional regulator n=1 Tax=Actinomycetospora soli TaxID=2893887 RepID=UPI001E4CDFDA|nr:TetR family transcriptional regulator C-terminal domain-containing protein [Actinomycetospora soli]MCD2186653.1 TetR family transcriptional regulator C-terminal domain-containing protein [Actinomycetospora soli]